MGKPTEYTSSGQLIHRVKEARVRSKAVERVHCQDQRFVDVKLRRLVFGEG